MTDQELKHLRVLQPGIVKRAGPIQGNDRRWWTDNGDELFIPLAIDPENPERGCLGMLDDCSILIQAYASRKVFCVERWERGELVGSFEAATPYLALLRCLAAQWGVNAED